VPLSTRIDRGRIADRESAYAFERAQAPRARRTAMSDKTILEHINELIAEEHRLQSEATSTGDTPERVRDIQEQLDQCWDLLRQRRARREFGQDPEGAQVRDVKTVEGYIG
jgi:hypothetical protein